MQQFGDVVGIDMTALVQHHGKGIGGRTDDGRRRRRDHALGEDWPGSGRIGLEIIVLDRRHQPAIGIVQERLEIGTAMRLSHFAGFLILRGRDGSEVDRPERAHEVRPGNAQLDLGRLPRPVAFLEFQHLAHRITDRD